MTAGDPVALLAWYRDVLGLELDDSGVWTPEPGPTVLAAGGEVSAEVQDMPGVGRFGWVVDPAGRRVELWQPS